MDVNSVCTVIIPATVFISLYLCVCPSLFLSPSYLSLFSSQMSHSVFVIFLAQAFAFAVSGGFLFKGINLPTILEPFKWKQYLPTEMENVNCNLI